MRLFVDNGSLLNLVRVKLIEPRRVIKETLSRVGTGGRETKKLYQICFLICIKGIYYIAHYKEMYGLLGNDKAIGVKDIARRNDIARAFEKWGLVEIINEEDIDLSYGFDISELEDRNLGVLKIKYNERKDFELNMKINYYEFNDFLSDWNLENMDDSC